MTVSVLAPAFTQCGSDAIVIGSAAGGVPSNVTLPATAPAVAGSTGIGDRRRRRRRPSRCLLPPPQRS